MVLFQKSQAIISSNLSLINSSRPNLTLKLRIMKTYLLGCMITFLMLDIGAQNATKSTIYFNPNIGLNTLQKATLDSVYHNMNDLNYHCFNLVNSNENQLYQQSKLLKLVKSRAIRLITYYKEIQHVKPQNIFIKYGGNLPSLWLHKPQSKLKVSGQIVLEEDDRQCFSFNPAIDNMIVSSNGNKFIFPPHAFENLKGVLIGNQNIDICVYEFIDKKSLVYAGLTTDSNGEMLETGGSFYIEANLNGEELKLRKGESYTVEMKLTRKGFTDMFTYYGGKKDGLIDWTVNRNERSRAVLLNTNISQDTSPVVEQLPNVELGFNQINYRQWKGEDEYGDILDNTYTNSIQEVDFYEMSAGKLGWINCDRFYEVKEKTTLVVKITSDESMVVRVVFKDINSVMPCYSNSNHKDMYEVPNIPIGEKVMLVAYSVKDENAIFGYKDVTIGENDIENITVTKLTKNRFKSALSELLSF